LVFISISQQNNKKSHTMALPEIKKIEIRGYLAMKGILPVSGNERRGMYRSPFRDDCNASFKVDYFAIGFPNDKGGFVLRSSCFKGCTSQAPTILKNGNPACYVFEGFMDFLSYLTLQGIDRLPQDVVVLNSVVNLRKAMPFIQGHQVINLCLDNDEAGWQAARLIKVGTYSKMEGTFPKISAGFVAQEYRANAEKAPTRPTGINDLSERYSGYKDLNDYLCRKPVAKPEERQALKATPKPKRRGLRP
jgi:hypothetical protein